LQPGSQLFGNARSHSVLEDLRVTEVRHDFLKAMNPLFQLVAVRAIGPGSLFRSDCRV
jgi:hypothetical protein